MDGPNGILPGPVAELLKTRNNVSTLVGATLQEYSMMKLQYPLANATTAENFCDQIAGIESVKLQQLIATACKNHYVEPQKKVKTAFINLHWEGESKGKPLEMKINEKNSPLEVTFPCFKV